eukprot:RCo007909
MAGGVKKPVNIFKLKDLGEPKEVFNFRLWFAVLSFALMGASRGIDEGLISGVFMSEDFQREIHLSSYSRIEQTNIKATMSSMVLIGSVGGALLAFLFCDRIGRLWATRQLCALWVLGIALFLGSNGNLAMMYAGRFIAGLGIGQTTVVGPVYIAEIAPSSIRGLCTCFFTGFVYIGIVLAYFTNYGCELNLGDTSHLRWMVPTSLHIMFAGLIFVLSFFQCESPRYFVKCGRLEEAAAAMSWLRKLPVDHAYVASEMAAIVQGHNAEMEASAADGWLGVLKQTFTVRNNLYRLHLTVFAQILAQWSGAGSITIYAVDLFKLLGISGNNESLLVTAVFGLLKFFAGLLCALFLVDVVGRKLSLLVGISLQAVSMVYMAIFLTIVPQLGVDSSYKLSPTELGPSQGAIAMIFICGFGWALGWNSMQYLLTAELFPLRIRALCTSLSMTIHFANQYGSSRAFPNMLLPFGAGGISPHGTFWLFAAVTIIGGIWVFFFVPETAGTSLESMDQLFSMPWYKIGRHGDVSTDNHVRAAEQLEEGTRPTQNNDDISGVPKQTMREMPSAEFPRKHSESDAPQVHDPEYTEEGPTVESPPPIVQFNP